jgi:hypothetical protein
MSLFGNNIKILFSLGLAPRLNTQPLSHLPAPSSLPTLWMLSPPSLIHRGRSAPGGVYILLIDSAYIQVQQQAPGLQTLRLPGLTNT